MIKKNNHKTIPNKTMFNFKEEIGINKQLQLQSFVIVLYYVTFNMLDIRKRRNLSAYVLFKNLTTVLQTVQFSMTMIKWQLLQSTFNRRILIAIYV